MITSILVLVFSIIGLFLMVNLCPTINIKVGSKKLTLQTFYFAPLLGAIVLLITGSVSSLDSMVDFSLSINPIKILILFFSITFISMCLDEGGFFSWCASKVLQKSKGSNFIFFILLYLVVSILTVFTSNDIVVLTFTPFICYYTKAKHINALPYLFIEFIAANTWSMMLEIGNPTNIYLGLSSNISFIEYVKVMVLPTLLSGILSFLLTLLIFKKDILSKSKSSVDEIKPNTNKYVIIVSISHLVICLIGLIIFSDYMYLITLGCAISLFIFLIIHDSTHKERILKTSCKKLPFSMIPFVLSMFIIVLSLNESGVTNFFSNQLSNMSHDSQLLTSLSYGYTSLLSCNILNNIPMSVLYSSIISSYSGHYMYIALYSSIIGSNLGALLTPIGALAGIMWLTILKEKKIKITFLSFIRYCGAICLVSALGAFVTLSLI